ncbi:MAG: hypothetical protein HY351_00180 [Candidatus Omnitrophica bacterium]|nr:hypothetical protein [Candidatus Omnitrophota bacterium]
MNKPLLLAVINSLYFQSQIEGIAQAKNIDFYFATQGEQLSQLAKTLSPSIMVVDLSGLDAEWIFKHISDINHMRPDLPIVGFVSHVQQTVRERAEKHGCKFVFTKSELVKQLPETIEKVLRKTI